MLSGLQLTSRGLRSELSDEDFAGATSVFSRVHCMPLRAFVAPELLRRLNDDLTCSQELFWDDGFGTEFRLVGGELATSMLEVLLNDRSVISAIARLTQRSLCSFTGRVFRLLPGKNEDSSWHTDKSEGRSVGLSINLGGEYEGGEFQLRDQGDTVFRFANTGAGDALIFGIGDGLSHRVTAVTGSRPRTTFAGWFLDRGTLAERLRDRRAALAAQVES